MSPRGGDADMPRPSPPCPQWWPRSQTLEMLRGWAMRLVDVVKGEGALYGRSGARASTLVYVTARVAAGEPWGAFARER